MCSCASPKKTSKYRIVRVPSDFDALRPAVLVNCAIVDKTPVRQSWAMTAKLACHRGWGRPAPIWCTQKPGKATMTLPILYDGGLRNDETKDSGCKSTGSSAACPSSLHCFEGEGIRLI